MIDVQNYIVDGKVATDKIVLDIKYRSISRPEIEELADNPMIKKSFFGKESDIEKLPKEQWDRKYLDLLSYEAIAEVFNKEYMLYLNEVAEFINQKEKKSSRFYFSGKRDKKSIVPKICLVCVLLAILCALIKFVGPIVSDLMKEPMTEAYSNSESEEETR